MSVVQIGGNSLWVTGGVNDLDADLYVERNSTEDSAPEASSSVPGLPLQQVLFSSCEASLFRWKTKCLHLIQS